ncbi:hypothetical protein LOB44_09810, partial [Lactobacillus delbrueckii subsp. lactis]|uniref:hypothetical protein n=1 Tax=Lactobacillus delbrueckii TaxID=1584 RepID=UPI001E36D60A
RHSTSLSFDIDDVVVELYQANKGLVLFLLAKLLNFQGTSPLFLVGSLSYLHKRIDSVLDGVVVQHFFFYYIKWR